MCYVFLYLILMFTEIIDLAVPPIYVTVLIQLGPAVALIGRLQLTSLLSSGSESGVGFTITALMGLVSTPRWSY